MRKFFLVILALLLPPVAVYIKSGLSWHLALNVFFCFALFLPAVVHAVWFVARRTPGQDDNDHLQPPDAPEPDRPTKERREPVFS